MADIGRCLTPETVFPPGQLRVLRRLLAGDSPSEIAQAYGLGIATVREHISKMHRRVGVRGGQLIPWAYMHRECCGWAFADPLNGRNG